MRVTRNECTYTRVTRRCEFYISVVCFVSKVCIPHAQRRFLFGNGSCSSLGLSCSRSEVGVDRLLQKTIPLVGCVSAGQQIQLHWTRNVWKRGTRSLHEDGDGGRESDRSDGGESGLVVAEVYLGTGRSGGRAARSLSRDDTRLLDDWAPALLSTTTERRTISNSRNPQAGELLPGVWCRISVTIRVGTTHDFSCGQLMRTSGLSSLPTMTNMRKFF